MKTTGHYLRIGVLSLAVWITGIYGAQAQLTGTSYASAKNSGAGVLKVTFVETPGFVYRDASGQLTGVCVSILEDFTAYVQRVHGVQLRLDYSGDGSSFANMYNQAKGGSNGVVGIGNITVTNARKSEVTFTPFFIENKAILITQKGKANLGDLSKIGDIFGGMTAYTAKGTTNESRIMRLKNNYWSAMPVEYASSSPDVLAKVLANPNGFAYLDLVFYVDAIKNGKPIQRHAAADDTSEQFAFVLPKGSDWGPIWEEFYRHGTGYRNSTEYKRALMDHLGPAAMRLIQSTN
ncbi:MAG TPA: ABC transporter substrate-binding protein [Cytophagales bacterium]|nr:ABC transporter substrate-binding protein [Cytophagales bacterium]HAA19507.1 ABC transporter substrate-binding protein [Cytophagales bacterium]HAP59619.1 ABC transporter substrate-binding protein [Cytophagales bacterium]